ncbi:AraC family transcriptional regulator, partial [Mesorhizobium sp. M8A.F.Ca.ET.167.01.1.1]
LEPAPSSGTLIDSIRHAAARTRRTASVCTGAFLLGEAGLLDGRRATTHWFHARTLRQRFPAAQVEEDRIFITDGPIWTSAGMSAGLDLALGMIEQDFGADLCRAVARKLVIY